MNGQSDIKNVQLQVYLLDQSVVEPNDGLRVPDHSQLIQRELLPPLDGILVTQRSRRKKPMWADFLEIAVGTTLDELESASASAILLLRTSERCFALTFGYGRSLIDPAKIERRFGLRVALNAVDPEKLRAVDSRTVEEMTFHTRRQASRISGVSAFGLDVAKDLLRGVTGIPREGLGATRISGSESVTISAPVLPASLPGTCRQLLDLYGGEQYKDRFEWIDRLQLVRDPLLKGRLDERLSEDLSAGQTDQMHLAPPEAIDWQNVSGFYYWDPDRSDKHDDLDIDDALFTIHERARRPITSEYIRRHHIYVEFREHHALAKYTTYSALVYELEEEGRLYVLSDGEWHEVDLDWANSIREQVASIESTGIPLPEARAGEIEDDYNSRAAEELGAQLFHQFTIRYGPSRDQIEFCDLLTSKRQMVHVKRKIRSATLSHLFMQGHHSAQLLAYDRDFRWEVRRAAEAAGLEVGEDILGASIRPADWEVVFAVIAKRDDRWPLSLPFFSQLSLAGTAKSLDRMGYRTSLALVTIAAN